VRLLLDECVGVRLLALLVAAGHDVVALAHLGRFVMKDTDVLATATADDRVVVSADRDFAKSVFWRRPHHAGFLYVGLSNLDTAYQAAEIDRVVRQHEDLAGKFIAVSDDGLRISVGQTPANPRRSEPIAATGKKHVRRRR
jgi:predicted nuclease of predicted toxin-antitoxin system